MTTPVKLRMHKTAKYRWILPLLGELAIIFGCTSSPSVSGRRVDVAWQTPQPVMPRTIVAHPQPTTTATTSEETISKPQQNTIAIVNGHPIATERVVNILLRTHGAALLRELVVLQRAEDLAAEKEIKVTQEDIQHEYDSVLGQVSDPMASLNPQPVNREQASALLDMVLKERNSSREEFRIGLKRNAYLRKIIQADLHLSEDDLRQEFERLYGDRVQIRHIQLANPTQVQQVLQMLKNGTPFAQVAGQYSLNQGSRVRGGLLPPFSKQDDRVPAMLREAAFAIKPQSVSSPLHIEGWYHIITVERRLPKESVSFDEVREKVRQRLEDRLSERRLEDLYHQLLEQADITIIDPVLRDAYFK